MKVALEKLKVSLEGQLYADNLHKTIYATDASVYRKLPLAVAFPKNSKDIQKLIRFATKKNTSLVPRAAGTSLAGQVVGEGIIVDVSKHFTEILSVDPIAKTVTVQPGVIRDELNTFLAPYGLFFGPNTSTSNRCMIGGMVGNNSSGTTSIQYGVTRDKVLSIKTILSDGSEATFGRMSASEIENASQRIALEGTIYNEMIALLSSKSIQNEIKKEFPKPEIHRRNTGYALDALIESDAFSNSETSFNLASLLCGSEGTLAFTTEITLQLDDLPPQHTALIVSHYHSLENSLLDVQNAMKHRLFTCEMMDDVILNCTRQNKKYEPYRFFVKGEPKVLLLLEIKASSAQELDNQVAQLLTSLEASQLSYDHVTLHGDDITMAIELRKAGLGLLGNMVGDRKAVACIEDTAVALEDLPNYIAEFTELMESYQQDAVYYAHAGAGELHLRPILDLKKSSDVALFRNITSDVAALVKKYRGSFSGEHGDGIVRGEFLKSQIGEENYSLVKKVKTLFDPKNIFNPGKIVEPLPMDESLRYVSDVVASEIDTFIDFSDSQGILRLAEKCNGSGDCRKSAEASGAMCPSYQATKNEKDTTRARANMLREVLTNSDKANKFDTTDLKEVFDLCLSCKACATECPSNVDIATAKAEFQYQYNKTNGISKAAKLLGKSSYYTKQAARFPKISNWLFANSVTSRFIKYYGGIAAQRTIPKINQSGLQKMVTLENEQASKTGREVCLFVDEFSNYLDSDIAYNAFYLLNALDYKIKVMLHLDSARALLSKGLLEEAKNEIDKNISNLKNVISSEIPLVGIEPSAILGFRDEYLRIASDIPSAKKISENTFLIEEFLASEIEKGAITSDHFTTEAKTIKIHGHCHQKALSTQKVTFDILNLPQNYSPTVISSGCCGMAGSFGYEKEHYDVSMKIGELKLFPSIRKAPKDNIIAANGTSCRHQIMDGTKRKALHPVTILAQALR